MWDSARHTYILHRNTLLFYLYTLSKAYKRAATSTTQDHRKRFCCWWHSAEEGRECLETWDEERECDGWSRGAGNPGVDSCSFITIIHKCLKHSQLKKHSRRQEMHTWDWIRWLSRMVAFVLVRNKGFVWRSHVLEVLICHFKQKHLYFIWRLFCWFWTAMCWQSVAFLALQELFRKVRSILNKLTPQMFHQLMKQVTDLTINTEERLKGVIDLVFEKAIDEPSFSVAYANMCRCLATVRFIHFGVNCALCDCEMFSLDCPLFCLILFTLMYVMGIYSSCDPIIAKSPHSRQTLYHGKLPEAAIEPLSEGIREGQSGRRRTWEKTKGAGLCHFSNYSSIINLDLHVLVVFLSLMPINVLYSLGVVWCTFFTSNADWCLVLADTDTVLQRKDFTWTLT